MTSWITSFSFILFLFVFSFLHLSSCYCSIFIWLVSSSLCPNFNVLSRLFRKSPFPFFLTHHPHCGCVCGSIRFRQLPAVEVHHAGVFFLGMKKKLKGPKERRKQQQEEKKAKSQINFFSSFFLGFYLLVFAVVVDAIGGNTHSSFLNGRSSSQPIRLTSWLRFPPNRLSESLLSKGEEWWTDWEKEPGKKGRKESKPKWINKEEEKKKKWTKQQLETSGWRIWW